MAKGWNTSPATVYDAADEQNRHVSITVNFNTTTLAIVNPGINVHRDPGCYWDTLVLGIRDVLGRNTFLIPDGDTTLGRQQLSNVGFNTVQDVTNAGISFEHAAG